MNLTRLKLALIILVLTVTAGCIAETIMPSLDLRFSSAYKLEDDKLSDRDPTKDFYYGLVVPTGAAFGLGSLPIHIEKGTKSRVWLDSRVPSSDSGAEARSLGIGITADKTEHVKDRVLLAVVPIGAPGHMQEDSLGNSRVLSFDFMLDPSYEIPYAWALHLQVWQCCGGHPPFAMSVRTGSDKRGPARLFFGTTDDQSERSPGQPEHVLYEVEMARGKWHHLEFYFNPQSDASRQSGSIVFRMDGVQRFDFRGHWGYNPSQPTSNGHTFGPDMSVEIGTYRQRQAVNQVVFFDNVNFSNPAVPARASGD